MQQYVRLSENYKSNQLIPVNVSPHKYIKDKNKPYFISMMRYNEDHKKVFEKTKSFVGMSGGVTNQIWADFDSDGELGKAFSDAKTFVQRLLDLGLTEENIQISFSGNKGIAIVVETESQFTIDEVGAICSNLAKGLETFDTTVYDHQRIFRLPFTKNEKSGLYKIPLKLGELDSSPEEVKKAAKSIDDFDIDEVRSYYKKAKVKFPDELKKVEQKRPEKKLKSVSTDTKPRHWKEYKWQILQGNFEIGERHNALMVLASTCRGLGYDSRTAAAMCAAADQKHCERTGHDPSEEIESNVIESVYSDTWKGGQYSPENNPWLRKYCERLGLEPEKEEIKAIKIGDIRNDFVDYMANIRENTIRTGIDELDEVVSVTTGMVCGIVGAASSGKTSLALSMLKNTSRDGVLSVFASLDMHRTRLFQKLVMSETDYTREELVDVIQQGGGEEVFNQIQETYKNVFFYDRSAASVPELRRYIERVQDETGRKVKLLMVDYFERLGSERSDDTAASKEVAGALQDLCNDMNICIVVLVQPNKFSLGGGPDSPIKSYTSIKGSSFLYQSFRTIISIWRPFFTPDMAEHDRFMQMAVLKNDLGELTTFDFSWNGRRGEIRSITEEERDELKQLLRMKENAKNADKGDDWS